MKLIETIGLAKCSRVGVVIVVAVLDLLTIVFLLQPMGVKENLVLSVPTVVCLYTLPRCHIALSYLSRAKPPSPIAFIDCRARVEFLIGLVVFAICSVPLLVCVIFIPNLKFDPWILGTLAIWCYLVGPVVSTVVFDLNTQYWRSKEAAE